MDNNLSTKTTHDLWIEARAFKLEISRPSPTTVELRIIRPATLDIVDGAVVTFHNKAIGSSNYPIDGNQYVASTDLAAPADRLVGADGAHVVAFYSAILGAPFPAGVLDAATQTISHTITITNTDASTIYYASIHPCSNVLQYYPIGIQSYPLESTAQVERGVGSYTGNIPSLPEAPISPTAGMAYFDQQLNLVQYWTGTQWIPTRTDSILTGTDNPGVAGQVYLLNGATLKVFDGAKWVAATSTNLSFKAPGPTWVPLGTTQSVINYPPTPAVGDFIWNNTNQHPEFWDGANWVFVDSTNSLFNTGSTLIPAFVKPMSLEPMDLPNPFLGQLFYNTRTKSLDAWTGTQWKQVNTDQPGTPTSDKVGIGNDGSYDERIRLIQVLKAQLGWPQNCVELKEEQFNIAIDNALDNYRMWSDGAYRLQYVMYPLIGGQQTYYLNSAADKTDRIVGVNKVHRLNVLAIQTANGNDAVWSSGILTSYYSAATIDVLSLHLISSLSEEFQRIFAGDLTFLWDEPSRELMITRKVYRNEKVILECTMERSEQEILVDRWSKQFIQNWALAECKYQLGLIRSRFSSGTPGAAGTITQNGELLIAEANQEMTELKEECQQNFGFGGHVGQGNVSFLIG